jgi:hypothetical protein
MSTCFALAAEAIIGVAAKIAAAAEAIAKPESFLVLFISSSMSYCILVSLGRF